MEKLVAFIVGVLLFNSFLKAQQTEVSIPLFDHILIFSTDSSIEKSLSQDLLSPATRLNTVHTNQGTRSSFFLFLNTYIEFIYLENEAKAKENEAAFGSAYSHRWKKSACPYGFGLQLEPFDTSKTNFEYNAYVSQDNPDGEYYLMPVANQNIKQPIVYFSMPHRKYKTLNSIEEVGTKVEAFKREDVRQYLTHKSSIKKLTKIILSVPDKQGANISMLSELKIIEIRQGAQEMILEFDNGKQGKTYQLQNKQAITINY